MGRIGRAGPDSTSWRPSRCWSLRWESPRDPFQVLRPKARRAKCWARGSGPHLCTLLLPCLLAPAVPKGAECRSQRPAAVPLAELPFFTVTSVTRVPALCDGRCIVLSGPLLDNAQRCCACRVCCVCANAHTRHWLICERTMSQLGCIGNTVPRHGREGTAQLALRDLITETTAGQHRYQ
jgi:hypothetical protein